ncbi:MAG TPA: dienelactone hydrolase family protein [Thermoanaerobaculia bacterium]|nr:dienelactone hydrolase family protein [Thermoanaerobaculia bacterium]
MRPQSHPVGVPAGPVTLQGDLTVSECPQGLVIFSHGSGSSRHSPRNRFVAERLQRAGLATLLMDLLTPEEDRIYSNRFDIDLLTRRLLECAAWAQRQPLTVGLPVGLFGASTGAASALRAAARLGPRAGAVVSRGGRPDLAADALGRVLCPTLLIVGGRDPEVLDLNRRAYDRMTAAVKRLEVVPGATHLFAEPGTLERVADLAAGWFIHYLPQALPQAAEVGPLREVCHGHPETSASASTL